MAKEMEVSDLLAIIENGGRISQNNNEAFHKVIRDMIAELQQQQLEKDSAVRDMIEELQRQRLEKDEVVLKSINNLVAKIDEMIAVQNQGIEKNNHLLSSLPKQSSNTDIKPLENVMTKVLNELSKKKEFVFTPERNTRGALIKMKASESNVEPR